MPAVCTLLWVPLDPEYPLPGCLEMLEQGWPRHLPQHPFSPCQSQPLRTPGIGESPRNRAELGAAGLQWASRAPMAGRDELDPPGQVRVDVVPWLHG